MNNAVAMMRNPAATVAIESQKRLAEISLKNHRSSQRAVAEFLPSAHHRIDPSGG
jgi:hypothetical protein